jgi:hypothetical protein
MPVIVWHELSATGYRVRICPAGLDIAKNPDPAIIRIECFQPKNEL